MRSVLGLAWKGLHAILEILPSGHMTYGDLAAVLKGVLFVLRSYGYWWFTFMRLVEDERNRIGIGIVKYS